MRRAVATALLVLLSLVAQAGADLRVRVMGATDSIAWQVSDYIDPTEKP